MQRSVRRAAQLTGGTDLWILFAFLGLCGVGLLFVYSASISEAYLYYGSAMYVFDHEVVWVVLGLLSLAGVMRIDYHRFQSIALPLLGVVVAMLLVVLTPSLGHSSHGATRWFSLGAGITIEPSELAKLAVVIYLAAWLTAKGEAVSDFKSCFVPFAIITGFICVLVIKQPDLGTTIVIGITMISVYFVAGADWRHILSVGAGASLIAWYLAHSESYRYQRLLAFTDPWKDPLNSGFHTVQALMALGSGGIVGVGFGNSVQKNFLPAPHTDSILAVIGEEMGLVGTVGILCLYSIIAYRGMRVAMNAPDRFGRLLAAGITCWITFQAMLNYGVITSSVPFTGVPLPFISYGGTSLIVSMAAMGILLNISRYATGEGLARTRSDHRRGNGRARVPRIIDTPVPDRSGGRRLSGVNMSSVGRPRGSEGRP
jgi:cell division protein FtsW